MMGYGILACYCLPVFMVIPEILKNNSCVKLNICFFHDILVDNIIPNVGIAVILKSSGTGYV